jgi:hypothetical protein
MVFAYLMGNERKGRYVALLCHDSLIFKRLTNQELDAKIEFKLSIKKNCSLRVPKRVQILIVIHMLNNNFIIQKCFDGCT